MVILSLSVLFSTGCKEKVESGALVSFEKGELWHLPKPLNVTTGVWVTQRLNHRKRLVIYCSANESDWSRFLDYWGVTEAVPTHEPFFEDLRKAMSFAEPYLEEEFNNFDADWYISPLVHGFKNFVVFDEANQKCIFLFSK